MHIQFLGTGTSSGIPMIGCDCAVCHSDDPRNRRRRAALYVRAGNTHVLVDAPPDFREQAIEYRVPRVDVVLFTHSHADHIFGFDDIRRFNTIQGNVLIPAYANAATVADLGRVFNYVRVEKPEGLYRPLTEFRVMPESLVIGPLTIEPLPVEHDDRPTLGFLLREGEMRCAYIPDCRQLSDAMIERLKGCEVMILDALRHRPHPTHLTVAQCVAYLARIGAGRALMTHMCHDLDHTETEQSLPEGVALAYDGLELDI